MNNYVETHSIAVSMETNCIHIKSPDYHHYIHIEARLYYHNYCYIHSAAVMLVSAIGSLLFLHLVCSGWSLVTSGQPTKPHIVFMMVDDWGWANVGYHLNSSSKEVQTPNIDNLVKEGLQLDQHYVFNWCSPSRSSFLSGRVPIHVNDVLASESAYNSKDPVSGFDGIPRNMTGIATKMKLGGYATHQVGKWDAGMATPDHTPQGRGFDTSLNYFSHANDYYTETAGSCEKTKIVDLWDTDKPASSLNGTGPDNYEEGLFKERALQIIENHNASTPLFLYYAAHIVHRPYQVPDSYLKKFSFIDEQYRRVYLAMVNYLDDVVGEIVDALKKKGLWDNLLFVASSDNGGPERKDFGANNFPLKGGKWTDWQGGVRVNAFASGGYLPKKMRGQITGGYIHIADWYATFSSLAGVDPKDERATKANLPPIDSLNVWPLISGQNSTSPRVDIPISNTTLISGDYKILIGEVEQAGWTGPVYPNTTTPSGIAAVEHCGDTGCLYDIRNDPLERDNLANKMPDVLKMMQTKLQKYQESRFSPERGDTSPLACKIALNTYHGFWGPFIS